MRGHERQGWRLGVETIWRRWIDTTHPRHTFFPSAVAVTNAGIRPPGLEGLTTIAQYRGENPGGADTPGYLLAGLDARADGGLAARRVTLSRSRCS